jgi:hypothetical protein
MRVGGAQRERVGFVDDHAHGTRWHRDLCADTKRADHVSDYNRTHRRNRRAGADWVRGDLDHVRLRR